MANAPCLVHEPRNGPYLCISSGGLAETELQIFQWGDGQRGMWPVWCEGKTALQGSNREEILGWHTVKETQGHRDSNHCTRTSSPKKEGQYIKRRQPALATYKSQCIWWTTIVSPSLHNYIIKWDHRSIQYHQFIQHQHLVPVQVAQDRIHNYFPCATTHSHLPPSQTIVWQFVTQGRSKFLIQNYPFSAFIKLLQIQIPIFQHTFCF